MIHKGEVPSYEKSFLALKDVTPLASKPTHSIKRTFLPISMQPKDFWQIIREAVSLEGNPLFSIKGPRKEIFEIEILSGGLVNRGQIVGGRGGSSQFSWEVVITSFLPFGLK